LEVVEQVLLLIQDVEQLHLVVILCFQQLHPLVVEVEQVMLLMD
jgi:hypothetical protein|tara:strand:- start:458 stop:589 length:132 start_codon:yes stop_codon:yes gene_type:complete